MRIGPRPAACLFVSAFVSVAFATYTTRPLPRLDPVLFQSGSHAARVLSFRSLAAQVDNQVVANLLAEPSSRHNDLPLTVVAGEVSRCELQTCAIPLTVHVSDAAGPVTLTFAVENAKGELSEVHHAECGMGTCSVSLILERGRNTISIGVLDGLTQSTAYTTLHVNATRAVAQAGKTEWF
jgi:hypothetical protein